MSSFPQLTGFVDNSEQKLAELREMNRRLDEALRLERNKSAQVEAGARELRRVLTPLYRALQAVFGEIDAMGIGDVQQSEVGAKATGVWKSWQQKLPGMPAKFIEVLLEHGEMSVAQIRVAAHCGQQTVYDVTSKLHKLGLLNKNGGKYSLKEL
jgi:hypothetical protein